MNIIRLLNKIREYQFRQNIIRNLKNQIEEKENQLQEITQKLEEAKSIMAECMSTIQSTTPPDSDGFSKPICSVVTFRNDF